MSTKTLAIVGGGFAGLSLLAEIVRSSVETHTAPDITLFEPNVIGPGLAYDIAAPDAFKLNHELDFMGSINVHLATTEAKDFYNWIQQHLAYLQPLYPDYDLTAPKEYTPRSLFGRYLQARYAEIKAYAADHEITIAENKSTVTDIRRDNTEFTVEANGETTHFDIVAITTGNFFNKTNASMAQTGKYFLPYDYTSYVSDAVKDGSVMLVAGSALSAYDAAIYALESGKYSKVIMASRRGMLRKVRGRVVPYTRKYITIKHLESMAGGPEVPFRLDHLLRAIKLEVTRAYGHPVNWKEGYSAREIIQLLKGDIDTVKNDVPLMWRSVHGSLTDDERHEIFDRLADDDKQLFLRKYASLYQLFSAPMPLPNAEKILRFIEEGRLELINGLREIAYNKTLGKFQLHYAHLADGSPVPLDTPPHQSASSTLYPISADICIDAMGLGRDIFHIPLYQSMISSGLAVSNILGGIQTNIASRHVIDAKGREVVGLYAVGHMACGDTVLPHNSFQLSRACIQTGTIIAKHLATLTSIPSVVSR